MVRMDGHGVVVCGRCLLLLRGVGSLGDLGPVGGLRVFLAPKQGDRQRSKYVCT